jgi:predicted ATPase
MARDGFSAISSSRSLAQWLLGYAEGAAATAAQAVKTARNGDQVSTLMYVLFFISPLHLLMGDYATAAAQAQELLALAEEKVASFWIERATFARGCIFASELLALAEEKVASFWIERATFARGCIFASTGKPSEAVQVITSALDASQVTGTTFWLPLYESYLAKAHAELGNFVEAWRCIGEATRAMETTKERMFEAEVYRIAGEIAFQSPERDVAEALAYFERALAVARKQQAKSLELRASMSLARLWRSLGKPQQARELLAPVYGWFTEGFDTRDLKEAKALLEELAT